MSVLGQGVQDTDRLRQPITQAAAAETGAGYGVTGGLRPTTVTSARHFPSLRPGFPFCKRAVPPPPTPPLSCGKVLTTELGGSPGLGDLLEVR